MTTTVGANVSRTIYNRAEIGTSTPDPNPRNDATLEPTLVVSPAVNVAKTANPVVIVAGQGVMYSYVVMNPGDVSLAGVKVTDDKCSPLVRIGGDTNGNNRLDPGEVWTYRRTTTLAADTLNTVTATGQPTGPNGQPLPGIGPVTDQATALVDVINPAIHVIKSGPATSFKGDTAVFTYMVTNAGDTPLSGVTVTDNVLWHGDLPLRRCQPGWQAGPRRTVGLPVQLRGAAGRPRSAGQHGYGDRR